jgi:hypothetical protein
MMDQISLQVADALEQPFPDGQFDLVWSMESGEHMPEKRKVSLFYSPSPKVVCLTTYATFRDCLPSCVTTWVAMHLLN